MAASDWIRKAERAGWRVAQVKPASLVLRCQCQGCPGRIVVHLDAMGSPPDPCDLEHVNGYAKPVFEQYEELVDALRRRRKLLGLDQTDLCAACGLADGHISSLESYRKVASPPTMFLWAQALGLRLSLAPQALPAATTRAIESRKGRPYAATQARFKHAKRAS